MAKAKKKQTAAKVVTAGLVALSVAFTTGYTSMLSVSAAIGASNNKLYTDYTSLEQAQEAAGELNIEIAGEGITLLKNSQDTDGNAALPLNKGESVSVFGGGALNVMGAETVGHGAAASAAENNVMSGLSDAGFRVNPVLQSFYETASGYECTTGGKHTEPLDFTGEVTNSCKQYNDAAFVVFSRGGSEGGDNAVITDDVDENGADHNALYQDEDGNYRKHSMMLSNDEEELLEYVKTQGFKKVFIVINSSSPMEMEEFQNDDDISGIIWLGRPGETGCIAFGRVVSGEINPSGSCVDEWYADFTADPTWYNFGTNTQMTNTKYGKGAYTAALTKTTDGKWVSIATGQEVTSSPDDKNLNIVDYDEGIYLGYKYYETYYYERYNAATTPEEKAAAQQWYEDAVTYPMGYGLSYTSFSFNIKGGVYTDADLKEEHLLEETVQSSKFENSEGKAAEYDKLYVPVTVKNTGDVAGKKTVQVYITAPYTAGESAEKSFVTLVGYAKTDIIIPGKSQTVVVEFNTQDMATWNTAADDGKGSYELEDGEYTIRVMGDSHYDMETDVEDTTDMYDEYKFELSETALQKADDFSLNAVGNAFSEETHYSDLEKGEYAVYDQGMRTADMMEEGGHEQTLITRATMATNTVKDNLDRTAMTAEEKTAYYEAEKVTADTLTAPLPKVKQNEDLWIKQEAFDSIAYYGDYHITNKDENGKYYRDKEGDKWWISEEELATKMAGWTQNQDNGLTYADMAGVTNDDTEYTINGETKTGEEWWKLLMNELSWSEMCSLIEDCGGVPAIKSIEKNDRDRNEDTPTNYKSTFQWACNSTVSATWNSDLAYKQGRMFGNLCILSGCQGWHGSGMDNHRTPFSGRNNEYYSQDGIQGGYIAAAVTRGAQDVGIICYVKHLAFNDQETNRGTMVNSVWSDEQSLRNILKVFQMAMQEGGSKASMSSMARVCGQTCSNNYGLMTGLIKEEWGWEGFLETDAYISSYTTTDPDMMIRAGNNTILHLGKSEYCSGVWVTEDTTGELTGTKGTKITNAGGGAGGVLIDGREENNNGTFSDNGGPASKPSENPQDANGKPGGVVTMTYPAAANSMEAEEGQAYFSNLQYYYVRTVATSVLVADSDRSIQFNGFANYTPVLTADTTTEGVSYTKDVSISDEVLGTDTDMPSSCLYSATGLPEGLEIDSKTGEISGKATENGKYTVTVNYTIDSYVKKSATFELTVKEAFYLDPDGDDLEALKIGDTEVYAAIVSDTITTSGGQYDSIEFSTESKLPEGLQLNDDGTITGAPKETGTFEVTVKIKATSGSQGGGNQGGGFPSGDQGGPAALAAEGNQGGPVFLDAGGFPGGDTFPGGGGGSSSTSDEFTVSFKIVVTGDSQTEEPPTYVTEDEVKDMIDAALENSNSGNDDGGCGSSVSSYAALAGALVVITAAGAVIMTKKKERHNK